MQAGPAEDAADLADGIAASPDWVGSPGGLDLRVVHRRSRRRSARSSERRAPTAIEHFGYAEESAVTTYLGTSTGTRLRFTGTEGRLELTAKSHERSRSAWAGRAGADPGRPRPARCGRRAAARARVAGAARSTSPLDGTPRCSRRAPWPTSSSTSTGRPWARIGPRGAQRLEQGGRRHTDRRARRRPAGAPVQRPVAARPGGHAVRDGRRRPPLPAASSTTACPPARGRLVARRRADATSSPRGTPQPRRASSSAPASTTCSSTSRVRTATSTTSSRARTTACW